jgi:hypothetical protein
MLCWLVTLYLQERYAALSEALSRDPSGLEAGERQQLERLAATLHRCGAGGSLLSLHVLTLAVHQLSAWRRGAGSVALALSQ